MCSQLKNVMHILQHIVNNCLLCACSAIYSIGSCYGPGSTRTLHILCITHYKTMTTGQLVIHTWQQNKEDELIVYVVLHHNLYFIIIKHSTIGANCAYTYN